MAFQVFTNPGFDKWLEENLHVYVYMCLKSATMEKENAQPAEPDKPILKSHWTNTLLLNVFIPFQSDGKVPNPLRTQGFPETCWELPLFVNPLLGRKVGLQSWLGDRTTSPRSRQKGLCTDVLITQYITMNKTKGKGEICCKLLPQETA